MSFLTTLLFSLVYGAGKNYAGSNVKRIICGQASSRSRSRTAQNAVVIVDNYRFTKSIKKGDRLLQIKGIFTSRRFTNRFTNRCSYLASLSCMLWTRARPQVAAPKQGVSNKTCPMEDL